LKADDETARLQQAEAAKSSQSLEQERKKATALALEAAAARKELAAARSNLVKLWKRSARAASPWRANSQRFSTKLRW